MINGSILVVDDDNLIRESLYEVLCLEGYDVHTADNGFDGFEQLQKRAYDIVITDLKMPKLDGIGLLKKIKEHFSNIEVILITSFGTVENAVAAMKYGAADYVTKPIIDDEIKLSIRKILQNMTLQRENQYLKQELAQKNNSFHSIVGIDSKMQRIYSVIEMIAPTNATVLIQGESGTGKGLIAQAIHASDETRKNMPFIEVSCGALPETLLESELFGHVKGAFTSAIKDRMGRFELANGGTIFLDEINTISPLLQVKLLRVLQDREFERVGDEKTQKVDIRIIAATNTDLKEAIAQGTFREDLFYRLNVINMDLPPLRERKDDLPYLTDHFISVFNRRFKKNIKTYEREVMDLFLKHLWPGNIRELENTIERATVLAQSDRIRLCDLPEHLAKAVEENNYARILGNGLHQTLKDALKVPERKIIFETLKRVKWNRKKTAEMLDINRTTLYNKMKEYRLLDISQ